jgi:hypothetical protein
MAASLKVSGNSAERRSFECRERVRSKHKFTVTRYSHAPSAA